MHWCRWECECHRGYQAPPTMCWIDHKGQPQLQLWSHLYRSAFHHDVQQNQFAEQRNNTALQPDVVLEQWPLAWAATRISTSMLSRTVLHIRSTVVQLQKKNGSLTFLSTVFIQFGTAHVASGSSLQAQGPLHHRLKSCNITSDWHLHEADWQRMQEVSQIFFLFGCLKGWNEDPLKQIIYFNFILTFSRVCACFSSLIFNR